MEPSKNPQTPPANHAEQHLSNIIQTNASHLQSVHELISHLAGKSSRNSDEEATNSVDFKMPSGYEVDPASTSRRVILRKKHKVTMADNGKDDVATADFEVHISMTASETTVSMGIPDHAGSGPQPQPGSGS